MRKGEHNYKGKFYIGQQVKVALPEISGLFKKDIACDTGVIQSIHGRFLRSPNLMTITYRVRFDKPALKKALYQNILELDVRGELLKALKGGGKDDLRK